MIDPATLTAYLLVLLGFVLLPGPATLLTLARGLASGRRVGVATGLGIAVGDLIHTLLAIIGVSAIVSASSTLFTVLKMLGAGYLIYLGVRAFREASPRPGLPDAPVIDARTAFRQAVIAEVLNPKSAMFFLAFLPQFVTPEAGAIWAQLLVLGVLFVAMGFLSTLIVALCAGRLGAFLRRNPAVMRWQGKAVGAIYCGLGLRLAVQDR